MKLIRFTALWCADCIVMRPRWQEAFSKRADIIIEDYDFDDSETEAKKYNITKVPQLIVLGDNNNEQARYIGMQDQEELTAIIEKYFNFK